MTEPCASRIRVQIDNEPARAELARLQARIDADRRIRDECNLLFESGARPFVLVPQRSVRRNEVLYRSELSDAFWRILEREAV